MNGVFFDPASIDQRVTNRILTGPTRPSFDSTAGRTRFSLARFTLTTHDRLGRFRFGRRLSLRAVRQRLVESRPTGTAEPTRRRDLARARVETCSPSAPSGPSDEMPAEDDPSLLSNIRVGCEWLAAELSSSNKCQMLILDCRSSMNFSECHIRDAVNFSIPTIMLRRLAAGKIDLASTVKCTDLREQIVNAYKQSAFVLYGDECLDNRKTSSAPDTMIVLAKRLLKDGCRVHCLNGECFLFVGTAVEILNCPCLLSGDLFLCISRSVAAVPLFVYNCERFYGSLLSFSFTLQMS